MEQRGEIRGKRCSHKRAFVVEGTAVEIFVINAGPTTFWETLRYEGPDGDEPMAWCQFGPVEELPLPGAERLDRRIPPLEPDVEWRITCFVTAVRHRRRRGR